ncbi:3-oxoacyl-[acyl-carrier-protein] reductase FabG [Geobacillus sp. BCO2]|nr:3-oxoacyl-[acyl-carrier-protein] reductase FabG [Geobacillus sp. BCO2]
MRYALITGASGGIGQSIARVLAREGYGLFLHYYRRRAPVEALKEELNDVHIVPIEADLSAPDGVEKLVSPIDRPVDAIVYNSGASYYGLLTDMNDELIERMVRLHMTSPALLIKRLIPSMVARKRGHIVFISSIWGLCGASCEAVYSMTKGGQNAFAKRSPRSLPQAAFASTLLHRGRLIPICCGCFVLRSWKRSLTKFQPAGSAPRMRWRKRWRFCCLMPLRILPAKSFPSTAAGIVERIFSGSAGKLSLKHSTRRD